MEEILKLSKLILKLEKIPTKNWKSVSNSATNQFNTNVKGFKVCLDSDGWISVDSTRGNYIISFLRDEYKEEIKKVYDKISFRYITYAEKQRKIEEESKKQIEARIEKERKEDFRKFESFLNH